MARTKNTQAFSTWREQTTSKSIQSSGLARPAQWGYTLGLPEKLLLLQLTVRGGRGGRGGGAVHYRGGRGGRGGGALHFRGGRSGRSGRVTEGHDAGSFISFVAALVCRPDDFHAAPAQAAGAIPAAVIAARSARFLLPGAGWIAQHRRITNNVRHDVGEAGRAAMRAQSCVDKAQNEDACD